MELIAFGLDWFWLLAPVVVVVVVVVVDNDTTGCCGPQLAPVACGLATPGPVVEEATDECDEVEESGLWLLSEPLALPAGGAVETPLDDEPALWSLMVPSLLISEATGEHCEACLAARLKWPPVEWIG